MWRKRRKNGKGDTPCPLLFPLGGVLWCERKVVVLEERKREERGYFLF